LAYRVLEIPNIPEKYDLQAFIAGFPTPEQNEAGRAIRRACEQFKPFYSEFEKRPAPSNGAAGVARPNEAATGAIAGLARKGIAQQATTSSALSLFSNQASFVL